MKHRLTLNILLSLPLFLAMASTAQAATTWYVNGVSGSDSNNCMSSTPACKTIGRAISLASSGDSIMVAAATYGENLTISKSLNVIGASASTTIIDGGWVGRVITVSSATSHVTLANLTMRNGHPPCCADGGGISNAGTLTINASAISGNNSNGGLGGGIANTGTLTISNSTINGNMGSYRGGGIYNVGTVTVNNSTISGNVALYGGGIDNDGLLTINNSTLSSNQAIRHCYFPRGCSGGAGGAIYNDNTMTINNGTLSGNSASSSGGGGILTCCLDRSVIQNSIVANNSGGNCSGPTASNGYNMSSDSSCNFSNSGDRNNTDPMLGPLQNNGGPTQTMALLPGSPAIDAGNPSGCKDASGHLLTTDQRGMPRPDKEDTGGCDMGAYEKQTD
jgi:hypothetical protein